MKLFPPALLALFVFASLVCAAPPKAKPEPKAEPAVETGPLPTFKRLKAEITAPLYLQQAAGVNTLANVSLSATAAPARPDLCGVFLSPALGDGGKALLSTVTKLMREIHHGLPGGHRVQITFTPAIAPDDAPAAALATALLLDSMIGGWETDPLCSVLGGLREDGKVYAATSALMRLTTASRSTASRIVMPEKNVTEAADCMINEGVAGAGRVQMFAVKNFDEVLLMAAAQMDPDMASAAGLFGEAQKGFAAAGFKADDLLKEPTVQESLRDVLAKWPNHISARLLLGRAAGRYKLFSLPSSVEVIERVSPTLLKGIALARPYDIKALPADQIVAEVAKLRLADARIDAQARPYLNSLLKYGDTAAAWNAQPTHGPLDLEEFMPAMSGAAGQAMDLRVKVAAAITAIRKL